MRVRGALVWEAGGQAHRDEVIVSDESVNGSAARFVILDSQGRQRASGPDELPTGSVLMLPDDTSMSDLVDVRRAGYDARRPVDEATEARWAEAKATSREAAIAFAEAELAENNARLSRQLQRLHPELFDSEGKLIEREFTKKLLERTGGKTTLTYEDILRMDKEWERRQAENHRRVSCKVLR